MSEIPDIFNEGPSPSERLQLEGVLFTVIKDDGNTLAAWDAPDSWEESLRDMPDLRMDVFKANMIRIMQIASSITHDAAVLADRGFGIEVPATAEINIKITLKTDDGGSLPNPIGTDTTVTMWYPEPQEKTTPQP